MKDAMVDTQVLVFGTAGPGTKATEEVKRWAADCRALLMQMEVVNVATVTVTEFLPYVGSAGAAAAENVIKRFKRAAFDVPAESLATQIIRKLRTNAGRCQTCLGVKEGGACKGCGNAKAYAQRLNDVYIAATAATAEGVRTLYTYDGGIQSIAGELRGLAVMRPPSKHGPLYDLLAAKAEQEPELEPLAHPRLPAVATAAERDPKGPMRRTGEPEEE